jgi:hypothetical protein
VQPYPPTFLQGRIVAAALAEFALLSAIGESKVAILEKLLELVLNPDRE